MFLLLMMWNTDIGSYFSTFGSSQSTTQTTEVGKEVLLLLHCSSVICIPLDIGMTI